MPDTLPDVAEAVVICTRNRPEELAETLQSIAAHPPSVDLGLAVMDASDPGAQDANRQTVAAFAALPAAHWTYDAAPSSARQRNAAVKRLPASVGVVHFIDDDVTVHPGYFDRLSDMLKMHASLGGVGGIVMEADAAFQPSAPSAGRQLFLLDHPAPGRVLPSGCASPAQEPRPDAPAGLRPTEWLNGCASYRRPLFARHRFDDALSGYAMLEDLDLSYRVAQEARLAVAPNARLTHRRPARSAADAERYACALTVHRAWFAKKHFGTIGRVAHAWSLMGRALALFASSHPHRHAARRGLWRGLQTLLTRDHPLLADRGLQS